MGLNPGRAIPKALKVVLGAPLAEGSRRKIKRRHRVCHSKSSTELMMSLYNM